MTSFTAECMQWTTTSRVFHGMGLKFLFSNGFSEKGKALQTFDKKGFVAFF